MNNQLKETKSYMNDLLAQAVVHKGKIEKNANHEELCSNQLKKTKTLIYLNII